MEQPLEPAHELGLSDAQLGLSGGDIVGEGQRDALELVDELRGESGFELGYRAGMNLLESLPGLLVERRRLHLVEQLLHHAADAHHLGRLLDHLSEGACGVIAIAAGGGQRADRLPVGTHDEHV
ncbi:unannotated protein [freshwater metagenome]|uniref:Unannotated protein n=1 Tax=freshwater metagenome TaxID=449393 RepID=A0A6J7KPX4_9ZZZZ